MEASDTKPSGDDKDPVPPTIAQQVPATPAAGIFSDIFSAGAFSESKPPADPSQYPPARPLRSRLSHLLATEANATLPQTGPAQSAQQGNPPPCPDPCRPAEVEQPDLRQVVQRLLAGGHGIQKFPRRAIIDQDWLTLESNFATRDNKSLGTTAAVVEDLFKVDKYRLNSIIIAWSTAKGREGINSLTRKCEDLATTWGMSQRSAMAVIIHLLFNDNQVADKTRQTFPKENILKGVTRLFFITEAADWNSFLERCENGHGTCSPEEIQQLIAGKAPGAVALDPSRTDIPTSDEAWFVYYLGLAAQVCYETVHQSNKTRGLVKAWKVPWNKDTSHPSRMESYADLLNAVESIKNGYIEIVEKAEEEGKPDLVPAPLESVWNLYNAMDVNTQAAVRDYTSDMGLFPEGLDLDLISLEELVQITTMAIKMQNRVKLPGKTAVSRPSVPTAPTQQKHQKGKGAEKQGRNAKPAQQFAGFQKHAYAAQAGPEATASKWSGEYPSCKDCWWKPVAPHSNEECLLVKRNMFPVPKPSTVVKGDKSTYLDREAWTALNKEVQKTDEWKAHRATKAVPADAVKHSRAQASSPAMAPTKYKDYGNETSTVIPALSRKSTAPVRQQRVHAIQKLATPTLAPAGRQAPTLPTTEVHTLITNMSVSTTPERKEKPKGDVTVGLAYATTEAETRRLSSKAESSVSHSKFADHPTQEVSIDMACVERAVSQAPLSNFKGGPDGDPDEGSTNQQCSSATHSLTLSLLAAGKDHKLLALAQIAAEHKKATNLSIANQDERVVPDASPSPWVNTPGTKLVSQEVTRPTSPVGVTTPGVCTDVRDVGRLVDPAPYMGTVQSAQETFTLRDDTGGKANGSSIFIIHEFQESTSQAVTLPTNCDPQLSATGFLLFETQSRLKKIPPKGIKSNDIWWPTNNPNMALVNLMWILQNLADVITPRRRRLIRELIAARESQLRIWDSVKIENASQLKRMETALVTFVADVQLVVGTRAWDLNIYRMRRAMTAAQLTKTNDQATTSEQDEANTIISGFQKTRVGTMTWETFREPEEKKRANTGLSPAPKKGRKLPENQTGQLSMQLLEGAADPELSELDSQEDPDGFTYSPQRYTYSPPVSPTRLPATQHDHSDDMPEWWHDATVAATDGTWWLHSVWNASTTSAVCGQCLWTMLVKTNQPYELLNWRQQNFVSLMVNYINISDDAHNALDVFRQEGKILEGAPYPDDTEDLEYAERYIRMLDVRCGTTNGVAGPNDAETYGPHHRPPPKFWPRTSLALDMWLLICHMHDPDYCEWASHPPLFWPTNQEAQNDWRMRQLLSLGYFPPPPKHLLHHEVHSTESLPRWVPDSIAWTVRWNKLVASKRTFHQLTRQQLNSVQTLRNMCLGDLPTTACTPPTAWPMRFWGFWWKMTSLGYAFANLAWPYQMLLVDIATMELPAKGSQVMTRVADSFEFTAWAHVHINMNTSTWSPLVDAAQDRDTVFRAGVHPMPMSWPRTDRFIKGWITLCRVKYDFDSQVADANQGHFFEIRSSDRAGLITKPSGIGWGQAGWANYCPEETRDSDEEEEPSVQRRRLSLQPQSRTLLQKPEWAIPEITPYQYCYREMVREDPSEFPGIRGKAPFRTSLNICYWDQPHQDCSHQHLPHHPQCECPACDQVSWDNTKGGRNPLEIAAVRIAPWDQRIMKNAGPLFSSLEGNEPTVIWNATVANQALDKYENHYPAWQATQEWSISTAVSLSDSGLAMGGSDSRSGKLPAALYDPFLPRNSATAYAEMATLVHAQVDTIVNAIPDRALPYARLNSQLHMLEWRYGSGAHPTATAPDEVINWGLPLNQQNGEWHLAGTGPRQHEETEESPDEEMPLSYRYHRAWGIDQNLPQMQGEGDPGPQDASQNQPHQPDTTTAWGQSTCRHNRWGQSTCRHNRMGGPGHLFHLPMGQRSEHHPSTN